ncbi:MAG: M15 family metallopeptidase [Bacilli bacterium]
MYKKIILFIAICISGFFIYLGFNIKTSLKPTENKLLTLGYNKEDITVINNKLKEDNINYLINNPYDESYISIIKEKDYDDLKLEKYIEYYKLYKAPINETIALVNMNIDKKYSKNLFALVKEKYYKDSNLERYYDYLNSYPNLSSSTIVTYINSNLDHDYYSTNYPSNIDKKNLILVNKYYKVDNSYVPDNLVNIGTSYNGNGQYIQKTVLADYQRMYNDMKKLGLNLVVKSSYRSYNRQNTLYTNYVNIDGKIAADTYSARPGYSEHQTGLALDLGTLSTQNLGDFEYTEEFKWMVLNAYKYGFILRYPKEFENITGYQYEPWHFRYVGEEVAKYIKDNNIAYEEYYEYFVK